ncbi:MAG: hypothetical protein OJF52_002953 [Nitrospira sp.]|nr:MAG: hypothetical protein OJF52_002953 [Nitrospira sp.]
MNGKESSSAGPPALRGDSTRREPLETPVCHMMVVSDPDGNSVIHQRKAG